MGNENEGASSFLWSRNPSSARVKRSHGLIQVEFGQDHAKRTSGTRFAAVSSSSRNASSDERLPSAEHFSAERGVRNKRNSG
jgi:hypothetical protein